MERQGLSQLYSEAQQGRLTNHVQPFERELNRREPAEAFARKIVEKIFVSIKVLPCKRMKFTVFGEKEANEAIGILLEPRSHGEEGCEK